MVVWRLLTGSWTGERPPETPEDWCGDKTRVEDHDSIGNVKGCLVWMLGDPRLDFLG